LSTYSTPVDIANIAATLLGSRRITTLSDSSKFARDANFVIDKVRGAELRRSVWTSATRRALMRENVSTTVNVSFSAYSAATTYATGDVISYGNILWISQAETNLANTPGAAGMSAKWVPYFGSTVAQSYSSSVQYYPGDVAFTSAVVYIAVAPSLNQAQAANTTYWHVMAGATKSTIIQTSPLGYEKNPTTLRKVYRLPANYLRMAPQDPKGAGIEQQNVGAGMQYNDWEVEAGYLFTADSSPFVMRFVADQVDVSTMDPLLCQAWGTRLALVMCETTTQSPQKKQEVRDEYTRVINLAKMVNAVEAGTTEDEAGEPPAQQGGGRGQ